MSLDAVCVSLAAMALAVAFAVVCRPPKPPEE
jgi:hypothetical protein